MIAHNPSATAVVAVIPGTPVAWARAKRGMGARTEGAYATFTPPKQRSWKHLAQSYMLQARRGRRMFEGPLTMVIDAFWPRPKSVPKRAGTHARPRTSRPDADNLAKQVCDAAIGVLYGDDAIVTDLRVRKWVAAEGDGPRVEVWLESCIDASPEPR